MRRGGEKHIQILATTYIGNIELCFDVISLLGVHALSSGPNQSTSLKTFPSQTWQGQVFGPDNNSSGTRRSGDSS